MGSSPSKPTLRPRQIAQQFARQCAKTLVPIEMWHLRQYFAYYGVSDGDSVQWTQESFEQALQLPSELEISTSLFRAVCFLSQFPLLEPSSLDGQDSHLGLSLDGLTQALVLLTPRYRTVLGPGFNVGRLYYLAFACFENDPDSDPAWSEKVQEAMADDASGLAATSDPAAWLESVGRRLDIGQSYIPGPLMLSLVRLMLVVSSFDVSLDPGDQFREQLSSLSRYTTAARAVVRAFAGSHGPEDLDGVRISCAAFEAALPAFPRLFDGLALVDMLLHKSDKAQKNASGRTEIVSSSSSSSLLGPAVRAQITALLGPRQLLKLYSGAQDGFSMRALETKVFKWTSPSLVLVAGTIVGPEAKPTPQHRAFDALVPPVRVPAARKPGSRVIYGLYIDVPWRASSRDCFGSLQTRLFQLEPVQDLFVASSVSNHYVHFTRSGAGLPGGLGAGSLPPKRIGSQPKYNLENVALVLGEALVYASFRHLGLGGSFHPGIVQGNMEFEDRFAIDALEVWGCGSAEDLAEQRTKWQWEEREAQARQHINVKALEDDRALLEMAGLVGNHGASGGSV